MNSIKNEEAKILDAKKKFVRSYFLKSNLCNTFFKSKRYLEVIWSIEALVSLIISSGVTIVLTIIFNRYPFIFLDVIPPMLLAVIGGFITLIAFSLSALALTLGFIDLNTLVNTINLENAHYRNISKEYLETYRFITYRFYFSAVYSFLVVILSAGAYIYINLPIENSAFINILLGFLVIYFLVYTISFTLGLIGDCIKMRFTQI